MKRIISIILATVFIILALPIETALAVWTAPKTVEIKNEYIKVIVSNENGGFTISTLEGDILKKTDNNMALTHRGANMDTSFTSFRIGNEDYIFGNDYGFLGHKTEKVVTEKDPKGAWVKSTWAIKDTEIEQKITMINNEASEQLGTAMISYTVRNKGTGAKTIKSRVLMDTQLGEKDFGYYELPKQNLGQGYEYFEFERTWDKILDPSIRMPADYFVRDNPFASDIVGFGVNSVFEDQKPYKMTFAHWANIAATKFDYEPDTTLNFTNNLNKTKTADSAAALYYDLGSIEKGTEKVFSTYYGVTANLKNKDNKVLINTTAPSKLEFTDSSNTAYKGSEKAVGENIVRINTTITNPKDSKMNYKNLAVVIYALGFNTQRQTDMGTWIPYDNIDPVYTDIVNLKVNENRTTYFDFKFKPEDMAQLGSFITKVYNMDESINELGSYAEEYCLGTTENFIILPGKNPELPAITLAELWPKIIYNNDTRYITVTGNGMEFFRSDLLNKIELRGDNGKIYKIPTDNINFEQGENPKSITLQLDGYMEVGRYELHFIWKSDTGQVALQGVPEDFTSSNMFVQLSSDPKYSNAKYGIVTVQRDKENKYKVVPYKSEEALKNAKIKDDDLLLSFRGEILQDKDNKNFYRMLGKDKNININQMLNYNGSDFTIEEKSSGTVEVLMDGKITTVGANTTVRKGTAAFKLKEGTNYIVPTYNERGEIQSGGSLVIGQDYIQLTWSKTFDVLSSIGGFLIDLKYGVLGKIENGSSTYDIISFGGGLDLGFLTPGGATKARQNQKGGDSWTKENVVDEDTDPNGFGFGLDFDDEAGEIKVQTKEVDAEPKNSKPSRVEAGVEIHDVLYGGKDPGYIGINMRAHASLPQIVSFLPNKIMADLSVNTIGGYEVGFAGKVKTTTMEMELSLVIKSNPSGAPIPDKLYFAIGGFEPGFNVDGAGVLWITGGGGGFDKLYDTIYGKSGLPPLTLLLHIEFDVTKILTGTADLELSLRSIAIKFDDLSLKKLKDAKFIDGGMVAIGWYPNFSFNFQAGVTYMQILKGSMQISASAGGDTKAFFEFVLRVSLTLPKVIPIVGGMQLASAELGGGTEKIWGNITLLELIKVGFIYYWGGDVEFTAGNTSGTETMGMKSTGILLADAGELRSYALFAALTAPQEVGKDSETGESQFVSVGSNLSFVAGSKMASNFDELVAQANSSQKMMRGAAPTEILTNSERTNHLVKFGTERDYILTVSAVDGRELTSGYLQAHMSIKQGTSLYPLSYYTAPGEGATDEEKENALKNANVNIAGGVAYIIIPKKDIATSKILTIGFDDGNAYDVGAIEVEPISELKTYSSLLNENKLTVNWTGENISDTAKIIVSISDIEGQDGVILNTDDILAKNSNATVDIPESMSSGEYYVTITLSDEEKCYERYDAGEINITNNKAPDPPKTVTVSNAGDDMLRVNIVPADNNNNLKGYFIDVYGDNVLADAGLYFDKEEEILIGGRYSMPIMDENGKPTGESVIVGYTPEKTYTVKVRAVNIEDIDKDIDGDEIYHCSSYVNSPEVVLKGSTPPTINISYDKNTDNAIINSNVPVKGELYINGDIKDGKWYEYESMASTINQKLNLPDGEYLLEFHGVDTDDDHAIVQQIISIDNTPPMVMLESPTSGDVFTGKTLKIKGTADSDAKFKFMINGEIVNPKETNLFKEGLLDCTLPLNSVANSPNITLGIIATDDANNSTNIVVELSNSSLAEINNISLYQGSSPLKDGKLSLEKGKTLSLSIIGTTPEGKTIDITDNPSTSLGVFGGNSASLIGNTVTANSDGQTMIMAQYDIGGNRSLTDGVVVIVEEKEKPEEPEKPDDKPDYNGGGSGSNNNGSSTDIPKPDKKPDINPTDIEIEKIFTDIKITDWYYEYVKFVYSKGLFVGTGEGIFSPNMSMTRGMLATVLWRMANSPNPKSKTGFSDLKADWYKNAVIWATENNIVSGYGNNLFGPNDDITREQIAVILYRYSQFMGQDVSKKANLKNYTDADKISSWAEEAMRWANAKGLITGRTNTNLAPKGKATRAEIAAILYRFIEMQENSSN